MRSAARRLMLLSEHEPARQDRHPPLHLSARLSVGLCTGYRGDRRPLDRPGSRLQAADLYRGRGLRQGRALCGAHSSSRSADVSDAPHRAEGVRPVRADLLGRSAGRNRQAVRSGRARLRRPIGVALLLRRHHGAGDARRHQPPFPCEEIFPFLLDHLRQHRARRLCHRHRQDRRRRSTRNGRLRPGGDLGHQSREYAGQCDDARDARPKDAARKSRPSTSTTTTP